MHLLALSNIGKLQGFMHFFCRGDHIVPNFEEIWPSKNPKTAKPKRGLEYYYDAMVNGPELSGMQIHVLKQFPISNLFHEIESEKKVRNGKKKKRKRKKNPIS